MKTLENTFHNTKMKSSLLGHCTFSDLQAEAYVLRKDSKAYKTMIRIEKKLCPHNKTNCNCSAFIKIID
jgi:hypothetical protein